jgi:hypothetical protein
MTILNNIFVIIIFVLIFFIVAKTEEKINKKFTIILGILILFIIFVLTITLFENILNLIN